MVLPPTPKTSSLPAVILAGGIIEIKEIVGRRGPTTPTPTLANSSKCHCQCQENTQSKQLNNTWIEIINMNIRDIITTSSRRDDISNNYKGIATTTTTATATSNSYMNKRSRSRDRQTTSYGNKSARDKEIAAKKHH